MAPQTATHAASILRSYADKTPSSRALHARATTLLNNGVTHIGRYLVPGTSPGVYRTGGRLAEVGRGWERIRRLFRRTRGVDPRSQSPGSSRGRDGPIAQRRSLWRVARPGNRVGRTHNYTIRDLTGVDIRPAREFPVDPANTAGFDNSGETLTMSPILLKEYLAAETTPGI